MGRACRGPSPGERSRAALLDMEALVQGRHISSAYRKPHTCWQQPADFNGGMGYTERARTAPRRVRIRKSRVVGLLVVIAAITALTLEWRASSSSGDSSSTAAAPIQIP